MNLFSPTLKNIRHFSEKEFASFRFNAFDAILSHVFRDLKRESNSSTYSYVFTDSLRRVKKTILRFGINEPVTPLMPGQVGKIFFLITEPTHWKQIQGICRILTEQKREFVVVSNKLKLLALAQNQGFSVCNIPQQSLLNAVSYIKFRNCFRRTLISLEEEGITFQNVSILENEAEIASAQFCLFSEFLERNKPSLVFIGNDLTRDGRTMAICSNQHGIPTFSIQHGLIPEDTMHGFHVVYRICVFGESSKQSLVRSGLNPKKILVSGAPYLDEELNRQNSRELIDLASFLKLSPFRKTILVAFSGAGHRTSEAHHLEMISLITKTAAMNQDCQFLVKLHRKDKIHFYTGTNGYSDLGNIQHIQSVPEGISNNIFDWIKISDCLVTGNSASAIEAILLQKPVFSIDLRQEYTGVDFIESCITIHSNNAGTFLKSFDDYINGRLDVGPIFEKASNFIQRYFYKPDGHTSERITKLITESNSEFYAEEKDCKVCFPNEI